MIVLVAKYYAKKGMGDQVLAALNEMSPLVRQHEQGCALYHVSRSNDNPDNFLLYEQYVNEEALQAHRETPYFKRIIEEQITPLLDKRERDFYTLVIG
ncbi:MAG TPA: putative quinol monooxygenase [Roseiflexaceae bacterium]|nr:putative quinol monooxygenase [Roseiflexaceae bacterium]